LQAYVKDEKGATIYLSTGDQDRSIFLIQRQTTLDHDRSIFDQVARFDDQVLADRNCCR
jgi:hypothetical protein